MTEEQHQQATAIKANIEKLKAEKKAVFQFFKDHHQSLTELEKRNVIEDIASLEIRIQNYRKQFTNL